MSIGGKVNYYFTGALIILLMLFVLFAKPAHSGSTQTNVSGSNTAIEGGYTSESTTTYETVRSIKWQFPECITTIEVGDHLYDSFDIIKGTRDSTSNLTVGAMETRVDTA